MTSALELHADSRNNTPWLGQYRNLLSQGQRALDLGCGTGDDSVELAGYGCRVVSLDVAENRVRQVPDAAGGLRVVGDHVQGLPFVSGAFDFVVASLSLHYFTKADTVKAFAETARVIRKSGWLICRVNAVGDVNFGYGEGIEIEPSVYRQPEGHLKRFFDQPMLEAFVKPDFRLVSMTPRAISQRGVTKQTLEAIAQKRNY